jgi:HEPN domain-containing protein
MAVEVGVRDLVRSYAALRDSAAAQANAAARLLQFYSVECGLKAAILGKRGVNARSTTDLPPDLRTHDLRALAKELRLGASVSKQLASCRRRNNLQEKVEQHQLHEAWRYGAALNEDDEKVADIALKELSDWCRMEHNR